MICCKLHPDAGTIIKLKGPHIDAYCKQCGRWLRRIAIDDVDKCVKPELDESINTAPSGVAHCESTHFEVSEDPDDVPWD